MAVNLSRTVSASRMFLPADHWNQRTRWAVIWTGWGIYFAAAECVALRSGCPDATLSSHLRFMLGVKKKSHHTRAGQLVAAAGVLWLADHLYRGG